MKFIVFVTICVAVVYSAPAVDLRGNSKFLDRPKVGDQNGSVQGEYSYVDHEGNSHSVKYLAGPKVGFKIIEDAVKKPTTKNVKVPGFVKFHDGFRRVNSYVPSSRIEALKSIPGVEVQEIVKVHHLRNEVPATVHKTYVPESIHAMAPPPIFSRRFIVKHDVPVFNSIY